MMMWHVSPVACAPTMRFVETTLPVWGALFLYVLTGAPDWSEYGDASRKSWLPLGVAVAAAKADLWKGQARVSGMAAGAASG